MTELNDLNGLDNPLNQNVMIDLQGFDVATLRELLAKMISIRAAETILAREKKAGKIGGPIHLGVGQEAVAVGVSSALRNTDRVFGAHRSHSHLLALSTDIRRLFAEVLGRTTGFSKGMGGSMHLWDQPSGFYGSVPIVAGTVPLALGAGLAAKLQKTNDVAVSYLGYGAVEEGVFHECLNFAKVQEVPILFVVENNMFASHMHISIRQPSSMTSRFAVANKIPFQCIDGNDVVQIARASNDLVSASRNGKGPVFLELVTYRWYGHVDWREDIDVGVHRSMSDLENWKKIDPILRLKSALAEQDMVTQEEFIQLENQIIERVNDAWQKATHDPFPDEDALLSAVYYGGNI